MFRVLSEATLFAIFWFIYFYLLSFFIFSHLFFIVYELFLRCIVEINLLTYLRENIGLDFVNFGSKTYIELFTYLCRQIIKLALYTHLNSAKKSILLQKSVLWHAPSF